jgi:lipopolysaccharide transport system permease protein
VAREFQAKYRGSLLGVIWVALHPLAMILVYMIVFSQIMSGRVAGVTSSAQYGIFLCAGVLTWGLFSETIGRMQSVFVDNANLMKKANFPRICLPAVAVVSATLNFVIALGIFLVLLVVTGNAPGWEVILLLPVMAIQMCLAVGIGMLAGTLNVFFRDIGQISGVLLQFWFWLTPIVYPVSIVPSAVRYALEFNPMYAVIDSYQSVFLGRGGPDWVALLPPAIAALLAAMLGLNVFRRHAGDLVDEL